MLTPVNISLSQFNCTRFPSLVQGSSCLLASILLRNLVAVDCGKSTRCVDVNSAVANFDNKIKKDGDKMKVKVTGFRKVNFTDQNTGRTVNGTSLYVVYPDPDVVGERSDKFFIDDNLNLDLSQVLPGVALNLMFNRRGKVSSFDIVKN